MSVATPIPLPTPRRELAHRKSGGLEITLYWDAEARSTSVEVHQPATQETIAFIVPQEEALEAFYHPFAHLGRTSDQPAAASIPATRGRSPQHHQAKRQATT